MGRVELGVPPDSPGTWGGRGGGGGGGWGCGWTGKGSGPLSRESTISSYRGCVGVDVYTGL